MTKDEPGVEAVARALVFAAGELVTATDGEERLRPKRQAVLDAMKGTTDALLREPQHSDVRETLSDCAEFLADIDGDLARRCEAVLASLPQDKRIAPIPMVLFCPQCGLQHIDEPDERTPDWDNPPHRSHLCHDCGCIWRPADVPTNGVAAIETQGKADTWTAERGNAESAALKRIAVLEEALFGKFGVFQMARTAWLASNATGKVVEVNKVETQLRAALNGGSNDQG